MYYYGPMMNGYDNGWGIVMMLFWGVILVIIVVLAMRLLRRHDAGTPNKSPLDIAKERYAKGEINKEEFEQLKKDLSK